MKILCSQSSFVMICSPRTPEVSCIVLIFPPGSTFQERFCSSRLSLSAVLYLLTRPRETSWQQPQHHQERSLTSHLRTLLRGEVNPGASLSTPSALHKGGRAAASGHRGGCMATTHATAPPNLLDVMFLQKPCTLPQCRQQITTVL